MTTRDPIKAYRIRSDQVLNCRDDVVARIWNVKRSLRNGHYLASADDRADAQSHGDGSRPGLQLISQGDNR